jgi:hypothetical protein
MCILHIYYIYIYIYRERERERERGGRRRAERGGEPVRVWMCYVMLNSLM